MAEQQQEQSFNRVSLSFIVTLFRGDQQATWHTPPINSYTSFILWTVGWIIAGQFDW